MTITRADLRAAMRTLLTNTATWPDASINSWIADAVRDYSTYFPRTIELIDDCTAGVRSIAVGSSDTFQGIVSVEYPYGLTPARYLRRKNSQDPDFDGGPYYDVINEAGSIWIGESPLDTQQYRILYLAAHTPPALDTTAFSMLDSHVEALKLYIIWQAALKVEMDLLPSPTTDIYLLQQLKTNVHEAEQAYRSKLFELRKTPSASGVSGPWVMGVDDRIY
jgi:hypothetical protein